VYEHVAILLCADGRILRELVCECVHACVCSCMCVRESVRKFKVHLCQTQLQIGIGIVALDGHTTIHAGPDSVKAEAHLGQRP
jgi:hypothetical protein